MLKPGINLGPFAVEQELGRGGMGVVFRARDTRLDRPVALKTMPAHLEADTDRLARFQREAKLLAALNHPNIGAIYGLEESDGHRYLVLEFIEGETLADRLKSGPIPIDEALTMARQIAEALEAAHEKGIVHRDLKPGNVMITSEGSIKVLDFGLARTADGNASTASVNTDSPTVTTPPLHSPTIAGVIMGTAGYMSPEQARGKPVDKRSDIFSFGCVLYEMLSGIMPFRGETVADALGATLHKETNLDLLPHDTPPAVRRLLKRCLAKDRRARLHDIADARIELENVGPEADSPRPPRTSRMHLALAALSACIAIGAVAALLLVLRSARSPALEPTTPVVKFAIEVPELPSGSSYRQFTVSQDGRAVAYGANGEIMIRSLDQVRPRKLALPWSAIPVGWTPDAKSLVVLKGTARAGELWVAPTIDDAAPRLIGRLPESGWLWSDHVACTADGRVLFGMATGGLIECSLRGGVPKVLLPAGPEEILVTPVPITGTDAIAFLEVSTGRIEVLQGGRRRVLFDLNGDRLNNLSFAAPDHLLVEVASGTLKEGIWAIHIDPQRLELRSPPRRILDSGTVTTSDTGVLVFAARPAADQLRQLVLVKPDGTVVAAIGEPQKQLRHPCLSPNNEQIAIAASAESASNPWHSDIFIVDRKSGNRIHLPDPMGSDMYPYFRDAGRVVGFVTANAGIRHARERSTDGSGEVRLITQRAVLGRPTPDDRALLVRYETLDVFERESGKRTVFTTDKAEFFDISPDGNWVAYTAEGDRGIRLRSFPDATGFITVTNNDAVALRWSPDGKDLYFTSGETMQVIHIDRSTTRPTISKPESLFNLKTSRLRETGGFDVTTDGMFVMIQDANAAAASGQRSELLVIQNWKAEFLR